MHKPHISKYSRDRSFQDCSSTAARSLTGTFRYIALLALLNCNAETSRLLLQAGGRACTRSVDQTHEICGSNSNLQMSCLACRAPQGRKLSCLDLMVICWVPIEIYFPVCELAAHSVCAASLSPLLPMSEPLQVGQCIICISIPCEARTAKSAILVTPTYHSRPLSMLQGTDLVALAGRSLTGTSDRPGDSFSSKHIGLIFAARSCGLQSMSACTAWKQARMCCLPQAGPQACPALWRITTPSSSLCPSLPLWTWLQRTQQLLWKLL